MLADDRESAAARNQTLQGHYDGMMASQQHEQVRQQQQMQVQLHGQEQQYAPTPVEPYIYGSYGDEAVQSDG
eukprot:COSAG05_NODE_8955_length_658_cov_1.182469_1_plen_71_part_10